MRKKGKIVLCLVLSTCLLSGCSGQNENSNQDVSSTVEANISNENNETAQAETSSLYGQITEINDSTITIALAERPEAPADMEVGGKGTPPTDMSEGGEGTPPSDMPEGGEIPPTGMSDVGDAPQMEVTFTGDKKAITVNDETKITVKGESATLDDLYIEDMITVEMSDDQVLSIQSGFGGGQPPMQDKSNMSNS